LRSHGEESLLDIGAGLGRGLQKLNAKRIREFLALFGADHALGRQIGLVAHEELIDIFGSVSVNLVQPLLDIVERLCVSDIIDNDNAVRTTVVGRGDGPKAFLSSGIPNLELDGLSIKVDCADFLEWTEGGSVR